MIMMEIKLVLLLVLNDYNINLYIDRYSEMKIKRKFKMFYKIIRR